MTHEELLRLQGISLTMARAFSDFCQRHGLSCYLCGGGCIGAARDGHMIAWDDDLDFFMPRDDYERAWQLWEQEMAGGRYALERPGEQLVTHVQFAKIRDRETTYVLGYQRDVSTVHGVALDVLPLDGYPKGRLQRLSQVFWAYVYSLYCAQLVPQNHGPLVRGVARLLLAVVPSARLRHRNWRHA
jgi:lipopolysaccharide cholinephosphotransferase